MSKRPLESDGDGSSAKKVAIAGSDSRPMWSSQGGKPKTKTQIHVVKSNPALDGSSNNVRCKQLKVEDALEYLEKVKKQFGKCPRIYNNFLEIMKNFKSQMIDTPGVIAAVSELFEGHPNLILGFNTFLPPGFKIEISEVDSTVIEPSSQPGGEKSLTAGSNDGPLSPSSPNSQNDGRQDKGNESSSAPPPPALDKAVHYVTRIKERFLEDENGTYKKFLDILQTYQQEKRSIKEVLDKVADLFKNHPDLLKEFTYFLPDAVQDEAKASMNRAAQRSQRRLKAQAKRAATGQRPEKRRRGGGRKSGDEDVLPEPERRFFAKVKAALDKDQWSEFVKCLDLFCHEVISRQELLDLLKDLFLGKNEALFDQFTSVLTDRGVIENPMEEVWFSMPLSEIDFSQCRKCTPSYRALPDGYPIPPCSERGILEHEILNDNWVSVPTGSEDFAFKNMRKNMYEEQLFKCEDDRFEIDMVVESNASTIRLLEPLALEIDELRKEAPPQWQYRLDRRSLSVTHLQAIARIYGDHGAEILELLRKTPAGAIPVILKRLKQKDAEWRNVRKDLEKGWKELLEKNYVKSLDHRSFYFRQHDKKQLTIKTLLHDIKTKFEQCKKKLKKARDFEATDEVVREKEKQTMYGRPQTVAAAMAEPHMTFELKDISLHRDAYSIIMLGVERSNAAAADKAAAVAVWQKFLARLYGLEGRGVYDAAFARRLHRDSLAKKFAEGAKVTTPYGAGTVIAYRRRGDTYHVRLSFGSAFLGSSAVTAADSTADKADATAGAMDIDEPKRMGWSDPTATQKPATTGDVLGETGASAEKSEARPSAARVCHAIFLGGNEAFVFLRLYHILCDRLSRAKAFCGPKSVLPRQFIHPHPVLPSGDYGPNGAQPPPTQWRKGVAAPTCALHGAVDYRSFLELVCHLVRGDVDAAQFEVQCRALMGPSSFVLTAMDKLVQQLVKQLHVFACDAASKGFLAMHTREMQRPQRSLRSYVGRGAKLIAGKESQDGLFAFCVLRGIPAAPEEQKLNGRPSLLEEQRLSGLPPSLPDALGPKHGWRLPPAIQIRYHPDGEDEYSLGRGLESFEGDFRNMLLLKKEV